MAKDKPYINVDYFESLTGEIKEQEQRETVDIGKTIKKIREEKGLSLDELSKQTGFDKELLENVEQGKIQPQLGMIIKLSKVLERGLGEFLGEGGDKPYCLTSAKQRKKIVRSTTPKGQRELYSYVSLAPDVKGKHMEPLIVKLKENPDEETSIHDGEEFIFVLDGEVIAKIGDDRFELKPGDSLYYLSNYPHMLAAKKESATILAVLYEG
ncbi:helix-turn-helix domain-containing protein [Desulfothermus sp.]